MPILNQREKFILIFLLCSALIGAVIGFVRHNWLVNTKILASPQNLPEVVKKSYESEIIAQHNQLINNRKIAEDSISTHKNDAVIDDNIIVQNNSDNKTESNKKNVTKNTSGLININSASKEDFMTLPYIGGVKAERIIQLRNEMGVFTSIEDLEKVNGIGPKTLEKIKPLITL